MHSNPAENVGDPTRPIENVTWDQCQQFCERMRSEGESGCRLLTAAQWEYACRAGSLSNWCFGDDDSILPEYAWYVLNTEQGSDFGTALALDEGWKSPKPIDRSPHTTNSVIGKKPNRWGICQMHGNVSEWCEDNSLLSQPGCKVTRGGSFRSSDRELRCSSQLPWEPGLPSDMIGLRICRGPS